MEKSGKRKVSDSEGDGIAASQEKPSKVHARSSEADSRHPSSLGGDRDSRTSHRTLLPRTEVPYLRVSHDAGEYLMHSTRRRGVALIFNHYEFDIREYRNREVYRPPDRDGTNVDRKALKETFTKLGFEVECFDDKCYQEIKRKLTQVAEQDHSGYDCLAVAVLTHGESGGKLDARDREYEVRELWEPFIPSSCPTLTGKPKLFFIQACKGRTRDPGAVVSNAIRDSTDAAPCVPASFQVPSFADILISYSTFEGLFSFRNPTAGTWYVQTLCTQLERDAGSKDLLSLLTDVNCIVGQKFRSSDPDEPSMDGLVQGPCFLSSLTRRLHLRPITAPARIATSSFD